MPLRPGLLEHMLILRQRERLQRDYALHLLWLTGLQLFSLSGGRDYPVPDPVQALSGRPPAAPPPSLKDRHTPRPVIACLPPADTIGRNNRL